MAKPSKPVAPSAQELRTTIIANVPARHRVHRETGLDVVRRAEAWSQNLQEQTTRLLAELTARRTQEATHGTD